MRQTLTPPRPVPQRATHEVEVRADDARLVGDLSIPARPSGVVLFAHGSGSGRRSPRNRAVAAFLNRRDLATLLVDLLTEREGTVDEFTSLLRFDVTLLARRLVAAVDWLNTEPRTTDLPLGLFGASTGAGAALVAAAQRPARVRAVVSRGGRPDLAEQSLDAVACPTLLIVGECDEVVIGMNERAMALTRAPVRLVIVPRASHLFEESGTLEEVARLTADWFTRHFAERGGESPSADQ